LCDDFVKFLLPCALFLVFLLENQPFACFTKLSTSEQALVLWGFFANFQHSNSHQPFFKIYFR